MDVKYVAGRQIERAISQGTRFLGCLSRRRILREILLQHGYTAEDHDEGWSMLLTLLGYRAPAAMEHQTTATLQDQAAAQLDQWNGPNLARAKAACQRLHPAQAEYIFRGLSAAEGLDAVDSVKLFLDRVDALRKGTDPDRRRTRDADAAAVQTLVKRGIVTPEITAQLRQQIEQATELAPDLPPRDLERDETYQRIVLEFIAWLADWRTTARAVITRRDYLVGLGLAHDFCQMAPDAKSDAKTDAAQ